MNNENKIVPELRFPEFANDEKWEVKTLGDITKVVSIRNKTDKKFPIYSINNKEGFLPQNEQFEGINSSDRGYDISLYKIIKRNTFAYNPARIDVGSIGYSGELHNIIISSLYVCFQTNQEVEDIFLRQFFNTSEFNQSVKDNVEGGIRKYLFYENFSKIKIALPKHQEQQKIASCLSSLDELIETQRQKLDALKDHKKGLLQNLFPQEGKTIPNLRFPEFKNAKPWTETALNKLAERIVTKNSESLITTVFTNSATDGIVEQREYFDKDIADKSNLSNYYIVEPGDYVYNPRISNAAPVGPISKNKLNKPGAMSPLYTVFRFKEKEDSFFEHYFKSNHWFDSIRKVANSGARFDRISITDSILMRIPVLFPESKEQQKIAFCLSNLDCLIKEQSDRLNQLREYKKGMGQRLFPKIND